MSREKAFYNAQLLSKQHETDAVVYHDGLSEYDAVLLEQYDGSVEEIVATFNEGFRVE